MKRGKAFRASTLLIEFTSVAIGEKIKKASKDDDYSAKLKHAGRRSQMVIDFDGCARTFWGGYTPKLFGGHFIEATKTTFEEKFGELILGHKLQFKGTFVRSLFPPQGGPSHEQQHKKSRSSQRSRICSTRDSVSFAQESSQHLEEAQGSFDCIS